MRCWPVWPNRPTAVVFMPPWRPGWRAGMPRGSPHWTTTTASRRRRWKISRRPPTDGARAGRCRRCCPSSPQPRRAGWRRRPARVVSPMRCIWPNCCRPSPRRVMARRNSCSGSRSSARPRPPTKRGSCVLNPMPAWCRSPRCTRARGWNIRWWSCRSSRGAASRARAACRTRISTMRRAVLRAHGAARTCWNRCRRRRSMRRWNASRRPRRSGSCMSR